VLTPTGTRPLAVAVGFIAKLPVAGMTLYNTHYLRGLQELGYDVHYVERQNYSGECYDPCSNAMSDDYRYGLAYLQDVLAGLGIARDRHSFIDLEGRCHGSGWARLRALLDQADFLLTLADPTWFDELERCTHRAFVDGDPLFTQAAMLQDDESIAATLEHYDVLFSYATRMGAPDCMVPDVGREWIPARPVVATASWTVDVPTRDADLPLTNVMNWSAGPEVTVNGSAYGHKDREFARFLDLPTVSGRRCELAVGGPAPKEQLRLHGWELVDTLAVTGTIEAYRAFIAGSQADLGIAKHAYVASRSGWFSDRSTCYLASGRPVLHQDTGYTDWLDVDYGVLPFSDMDSLLSALDRLDADYERHAAAARQIAEEHFEAQKVIGEMLDRAGFR
jgi:hypothetical protein